MSWQATQAVRKRTQFIDDTSPLLILLALADRATPDGIVGVAGERTKCMTIQGIANESRIHKNTVLKWMPILLESGEVQIKAQGGVGRGSWTVYKLTHLDDYEVVPIQQETVHGSQEFGNTNEHVPINGELAQQVQELAQQVRELAQQVRELVHGIGTNGTRFSHTRVDPVDPKDDPSDPVFDPFDAGAGADDAPMSREDELWQMATAVVSQWQDETHNLRPLSPSNERDRVDYFEPALLLVAEFAGDGEAAWRSLMAAYDGMLQRNLTPRRLEPVVMQALADRRRQSLPPPVMAGNRNGKLADNLAAIEEVFGGYG